MLYLQTAIRRAKHRGIPGVRRLAKILQAAGITTVRCRLPHGDWVYWIKATCHGRSCMLVASIPRMIHVWLEEPTPEHGLNTVTVRVPSMVDIFLDMQGNIRIQNLDTLGFVVHGDTGIGEGHWMNQELKDRAAMARKLPVEL